MSGCTDEIDETNLRDAELDAAVERTVAELLLCGPEAVAASKALVAAVATLPCDHPRGDRLARRRGRGTRARMRASTIFISNRANAMPMQMRGPAPNGR